MSALALTLASWPLGAAVANGLLALLLAGPSFWLERDGTTLRLTADLSSMVDADLERQLMSGLTTTLRLRIELRDHEQGSLRGGIWRVASARWDLWGERLRASIQDSTRSSDPPRVVEFAEVRAFAKVFLDTQASVLALEIASAPTVYQVHATLEVNPLTDEQLARTRRWLTGRAETEGLDPIRRGLFGSFIRLFDNWRAPRAERVVSAAAHPIRADRLPFYRAR